MLPFGSITSVVPLVVLGFAYLVYLGAMLLNKPDINEFKGREAAINTIEADANEDLRSIPDFRSLNDNDTVAINTTDCKITNWSYIVSLVAEIPPARPLVRQIVSQFLPRPPPVC